MKRSSRPPCSIQILTGPPRSGKTTSIIQTLVPAIKENRCSELLILVPSNLKADEINELILSDREINGFFNLKVLTFLDLTKNLFHELNLSGKVNSPLVRRWMVQQLLEKLPLEHLKEIKKSRGLTDLCIDLIRTLKEAGVLPDEFKKRMEEIDASPILLEMGHVFQTYETARKKRNLLDREDLFSLAAQNMKKETIGPFSHVHTIAVTGFYDFTPLQLKLLSSLSQCKNMEKIIVTLLHQEGSGPGQRFIQRTLDRIRYFLPMAEVSTFEQQKETLSKPLSYLSRHFLTNPEENQEMDCDETIEIIHTPGTYREVEEMARKIRHLIYQETYTFKEMAVVYRNLNHYQDKVREIFRFYKIPLRMATGLPLQSNPLVQSVMGILEIPRSGYQRGAVSRFLRSSYFKYEPLVQSTITAERFDALAREAMIHGRKEEWKKRFTGRAENLQLRMYYLNEGNGETLDEDLRQEKINDTQRKIQDYSECTAMIEALFKTLSVIPKSASIREYLDILNQLTDSLSVDKEITASKNPRLIRRDQIAWKRFQELLDQILEDHESIQGSQKIPLSEFIRLLNQALMETNYSPHPPNEDAVLLTDALGIRDLHRSVVFIGGLVEEAFPRAHTPDPIFSDLQRAHLNKRLSPDRWISLSTHWREEEELLFLLAANSATRKLFLTYPRTNDQAKEILPSRYIERVRSLFTKETIDETGILLKDPLPDRNHLFRKKELLEYTFSSLYRPASEEPDTPILYNHLLREDDERVRSLLHGLRVIEARHHEEDAYSGRLSSQAASLIRKEEGPYSVTALERYGTCPFQYFCERELKVRPFEEVEDEINAMDMGSLFHRILERFYKEATGPVTEKNLTAVKEQMHKIIDRLLTRQEFQGVPGHQKVWEIRKAEVYEILDRFLDKEIDEFIQTGEVPTHFETSFGMEPRADCDPLSTTEPLNLESETGPIHIMGKVDRIDLSEGEGGETLFSIVDYKTGKNAPTVNSIINGESLQLPIYAGWVKKAFSNQREMKRGSYYLLKSGERKGQIPTKNETWEELLKITKKHVQNYVESIRKGEFPVGEKKCSDYCRYNTVCRIGEE